MQFRHRSLPWNIVFGAGSMQRLPSELATLGRSRALVLTTPAQAADGLRVAELLGAARAGVFDQARMHVPATTVARALEVAAEVDADCTVAVGGGSTTGLGKLLALRADLDNIVLPTSYAGSEMTNIWGVTEDGKKTTGRDDRVVPTLTIYDPELTLRMPPKFAAASGMNALAQASVNIATDRPNPVVQALATDAVRALARSLPRVLDRPGDIEARSGALYGACLAGAALGTGKTGLHHRLCHVLGGTYDTPHAETHATLLPHSIAYNAAAAADGTARLAEALDVDDAATGLFDLGRSLGVPESLDALGVSEGDLDRVAELAVETPLENPAPVTHQAVRSLLDDAFHGRPPPGAG